MAGLALGSGGTGVKTGGWGTGTVVEGVRVFGGAGTATAGGFVRGNAEGGVAIGGDGGRTGCGWAWTGDFKPTAGVRGGT